MAGLPTAGQAAKNPIAQQAEHSIRRLIERSTKTNASQSLILSDDSMPMDVTGDERRNSGEVLYRVSSLSAVNEDVTAKEGFAQFSGRADGVIHHR